MQDSEAGRTTEAGPPSKAGSGKSEHVALRRHTSSLSRLERFPKQLERYFTPRFGAGLPAPKSPTTAPPMRTQVVVPGSILKPGP